MSQNPRAPRSSSLRGVTGTAAAALAVLALVALEPLVSGVVAQQLFGFGDPMQPQAMGQLPQAINTNSPLSSQAILAAAASAQGGGAAPTGSGSGGPCPVLTFAHAVNRDALMGAAHTMTFSAQAPVASSSVVMASSAGGAAASWTVMFVDAHFRINTGPEINIRMNPASADARSWVLPGLNLMEGDSVKYYFTICTIMNGVRTDCDSPVFTFTRSAATTPTTGTGTGANGGGGTALPLLSGQMPFQPQIPVGGSTSLPQQQFQPLSANPLPLPSSGGSAVCPAVNWQWQMLLQPNAQNTFGLQFIAQSGTNPALQLLGVSAVDVHYVLSGAPSNVRMTQMTPNAWSSNIVLTPAQVAAGANTVLTFYFTYTAMFAGAASTTTTAGSSGAASNTITCDTAQQTLNAASGVFGPSGAPTAPAGSVTPSAAGTNPPAPPTAPTAINPFRGMGTGTGAAAPSMVPPGTPDFARGQSITTPEAVAQFLRDAQQNANNPFSGASGAQALLDALQRQNNAPVAPSSTLTPPLPPGAQAPGCPAIDLNHQVTQAPDGAWTVTFFAIQPRAPGAVLQSVERVGITALVSGSTGAAGPLVAQNTPMDRINGLVWEWDLPAAAASAGAAGGSALKAGDTLRFNFTYIVLVSGASLTCNSSQFAFSVSPMGGPMAPAGQPVGATTPMQMAQLQQQMQSAMAGFNPMRPTDPSGVQPLSAPPTGAPSTAVPTSITDRIAQGQLLPPNARSLADMQRGTQSEVCPSLAFTHRIESNPSGAAPTAPPTTAPTTPPSAPGAVGGLRAVFTATGAVKGTIEKLNFVDLHVQAPNAPEINIRMTQDSASPMLWTAILPIASLPSGATYYFTHCTTIGGKRVDCDTPLVTLSAGVNAAGATAPPTAPPTISPLGTGTGGAQSLFPLTQPQPLFGGGSGTPTAPLLPSGPPSNPSTGGTGSTTTPPTASGVACPALQWSYQFVPSTATAGAYRLVITSGRPLRPDATVSKLNYWELHSTTNGAAPQNVAMKPVANSQTDFDFEPIRLNAGDTFHWYPTYSVTLTSAAGGAAAPVAGAPIQCDGGVQMFVAPGAGGAPVNPFGTATNPATGGTGTPTSPLLSGVPALGSSSPPLTPGAPTGSGAGNLPAPPTPTSVGPVCPAITFERQIMPLGNGNYELRFIGNGVVSPSATLQAINFVDAHYVVNAQPQVNTKMIRKTNADGANGMAFALPLSFGTGAATQFAVYFTYSALLSSATTPVQCDTAVFSFATN